MQDLTFKINNNRFNYRVSAVILDNDKILAMKDENSPYYYLPGGRVHLHEKAEDAILRELKEELEIGAKIIRPLWFVENFFEEDQTKEKFHELCIYYLIDFSESDLLTRGSSFDRCEGKHSLHFEWISIHKLNETYLYPLFIKEKIFKIPNTLEMITEEK